MPAEDPLAALLFLTALSLVTQRETLSAMMTGHTSEEFRQPALACLQVTV